MPEICQPFHIPGKFARGLCFLCISLSSFYWTMNTFFDVLLKLLLEFCYIIILQDRVSAAVIVLQLWLYYSCDCITVMIVLQLWLYYSCDCITVKIYISLFSLHHITTFLDLDFLCQMSRFFFYVQWFLVIGCWLCRYWTITVKTFFP